MPAISTTGDDGLMAFEKVMRDSQRQNCGMGGILNATAIILMQDEHGELEGLGALD